MDGDAAAGVDTNLDVRYRGKTVVLCPGTFMKGLVHVGLVSYPAGRAGDFPSMRLSDSLRRLGFSVGRLKTGTTPRLDAKTIDFSKTVRQEGDDRPVPFSFDTAAIRRPQLPCFLTYTNAATHEAIRSGLSRSPLYSGIIKGIGPRYCPSIEDKVVRFSGEGAAPGLPRAGGAENRGVLPQRGLRRACRTTSSVKMLRTIPGLEAVEIVRPGYAIEYDFVDPVQLHPSLETKLVKNLFHAGQINGTSGYEEAGAQGIVAGINAALRVNGEPPMVLSRADAYIGVLIDDLTTKGAREPYRMFTSRAEYRLLLREDNADLRLSETGRRVGLLPEERYRRFLAKREGIEAFRKRLEETRVGAGHPLCAAVEAGGGCAPAPRDHLRRGVAPARGDGRDAPCLRPGAAGGDPGGGGAGGAVHQVRRVYPAAGRGSEKAEEIRRDAFPARIPVRDRSRPVRRGPGQARPGPARLHRPGAADPRGDPGGRRPPAGGAATGRRVAETSRSPRGENPGMRSVSPCPDNKFYGMFHVEHSGRAAMVRGGGGEGVSPDLLREVLAEAGIPAFPAAAASCLRSTPTRCSGGTGRSA